VKRYRAKNIHLYLFRECPPHADFAMQKHLRERRQPSNWSRLLQRFKLFLADHKLLHDPSYYQ